MYSQQGKISSISHQGGKLKHNINIKRNSNDTVRRYNDLTAGLRLEMYTMHIYYLIIVVTF